MCSPYHTWLSIFNISNALDILQLDSLEQRRNVLALKFAMKSEKHQKFQSWFIRAKKTVNTRTKTPKYCEVKANHTRFQKSPSSYGRGYSQVDYLDIKSTSQVDYLDIKSTSQVDYIWI